uniref:Protein kinase domain-containing protein n=1 Tax=Macrostomum lignano TaxID=282301 RepID=A0A1I8IXV0_9PLAT
GFARPPTCSSAASLALPQANSGLHLAGDVAEHIVPGPLHSLGVALAQPLLQGEVDGRPQALAAGFLVSAHHDVLRPHIEGVMRLAQRQQHGVQHQRVVQAVHGGSQGLHHRDAVALDFVAVEFACPISRVLRRGRRRRNLGIGQVVANLIVEIGVRGGHSGGRVPVRARPGEHAAHGSAAAREQLADFTSSPGHSTSQRVNWHVKHQLLANGGGGHSPDSAHISISVLAGHGSVGGRSQRGCSGIAVVTGFLVSGSSGFSRRPSGMRLHQMKLATVGSRAAKLDGARGGWSQARRSILAEPHRLKRRLHRGRAVQEAAFAVRRVLLHRAGGHHAAGPAGGLLDQQSRALLQPNDAPSGVVRPASPVTVHSAFATADKPFRQLSPPVGAPTNSVSLGFRRICITCTIRRSCRCCWSFSRPTDAVTPLDRAQPPLLLLAEAAVCELGDPISEPAGGGGHRYSGGCDCWNPAVADVSWRQKTGTAGGAVAFTGSGADAAAVTNRSAVCGSGDVTSRGQRAAVEAASMAAACLRLIVGPTCSKTSQQCSGSRSSSGGCLPPVPTNSHWLHARLQREALRPRPDFAQAKRPSTLRCHCNAAVAGIPASPLLAGVRLLLLLDDLMLTARSLSWKSAHHIGWWGQQRLHRRWRQHQQEPLRLFHLTAELLLQDWLLLLLLQLVLQRTGQGLDWRFRALVATTSLDGCEASDAADSANEWRQSGGGYRLLQQACLSTSCDNVDESGSSSVGAAIDVGDRRAAFMEWRLLCASRRSTLRRKRPTTSSSDSQSCLSKAFSVTGPRQGKSSSHLQVTSLWLASQALMAWLVAAKIKILRDYQAKLSNAVSPPPPGSDIANTLKNFSQTLLGFLKDCPALDPESLGGRSKEFSRLHNTFPNLCYSELYYAVIYLLDVMHNVQSGQAAAYEAILTILAQLIPFLEVEILETMPYTVACMLPFLPQQLCRTLVDCLTNVMFPLILRE